jgi:hypothetical protein
MWMVGNALIFVVAQLYEKHAISTSDQVPQHATKQAHPSTRNNTSLRPEDNKSITNLRIPKP